MSIQSIFSTVSNLVGAQSDTNSLQSFINTFGKLDGVATTNRYVVSFSIPSDVATISDNRHLALLCEAAQLPGLQIVADQTSQPYGFGPYWKAPTNVIFTDVDFVFIGDGKGKVHSIITAWMNYIINFNNNYIGTSDDGLSIPFFVNYMDNYCVDITITTLDAQNNNIITYTLFDAYPSFMPDINLRWADQNNYMNIPVKFNFSRWKSTYAKLSGAEASSLQSLIQGISSALGGNISSLVNTGTTILTNGSSNYVAAFNGYQSTISSLISDTLNN